MPSRRELVLASLVALALMSLVTPGCAKTPKASSNCTRGAERACRGPNNCEGTQSCSGTPTEWRQCECATQTPPIVPTSVGQACDIDSDCAEEEQCLDGESAFLGGQLVAKTCVRDCSANPSICSQLRTDSVCVKASTGQLSMTSMPQTGGDRAYCFESCTLGTADNARCHSRVGVACSALEEGGAFCRPLCVADEECDDGVCDPLRGVCTKESTIGLPLGSECDSNAVEPECEGLCLTVDDLSYCTGRCIYGDIQNCGDSEAPGVCFIREGNGSLGDVGFCTPLCKSEQDCSHEGATCSAFDDPEIEAVLDAAGTCLADEDSRDGGVQDAGALGE